MKLFNIVKTTCNYFLNELYPTILPAHTSFLSIKVSRLRLMRVKFNSCLVPVRFSYTLHITSLRLSFVAF
jgi:hypothetical protein